MAKELTGEELKNKFSSLLGNNSYDIWDEESTLETVSKLSLNEEEYERMKKGLKKFGDHLSETDRVLMFKMKEDVAFLFFPYCSVQFQGAVMVSKLTEINIEIED